MSQTKNQQIQFIEDCLLPRYGVDSCYVDLEALVDSSLTLRENWNAIKERYNLKTEYELRQKALAAKEHAREYQTRNKGCSCYV